MLIAGHQVSGVGLGTAQFAFRSGTEVDSVATVHAALDAGVTLIDTALAYTRLGVESYAEQVVARALRSYRGARPLVATKGGHWREGDQFPVSGRPAALRAHCEISLRTLGVSRIDLYQLHHVDPSVPFAESVGALEDLRSEGKIAAIGLSNVSLAQLLEALAIAPIASVQNRLSLAVPGDLPKAQACAEQQLANQAYAPFDGPSGMPPKAALSVARQHGVSVHRALLAWLRAESPNIVPLAGASRPATIRDSATPFELTAEELDLLRSAPT
jgi:aryl-alcohol dehydrogenase-like predicted oxidoreductase